MPRRKAKIKARTITQSLGPLPLRIADNFLEQLLVFTDASQLRTGGMAAVLFSDSDAEPIIETRSVDGLGSNELELLAVLFGLLKAQMYFPIRKLTLFSDNIDAVNRMKRAKIKGIEQDPELSVLMPGLEMLAALDRADFCWIKGHSYCRGNTLADQYAREAAC